MSTVEFRIDEDRPTSPSTTPCRDCSVCCITACPADLFVPTADGGILFNYEQCFGAAPATSFNERARSDLPRRRPRRRLPPHVSAPGTPVPALVAACVKWVDLRPQVDAARHRRPSGPGGGFSSAAPCAVGVALRLGAAWDARTVVVCAGPPAADAGLRDLLAAGADRALRVDLPGADVADVGAQTGEAAAGLLAPVLSELGVSVVVCGDVSADLGSGTVPAYLAHHLGAAQALGLLDVTVSGSGHLGAVRRLDGGRREVLEVAAPAVLSVEAAWRTAPCPLSATPSPVTPRRGPTRSGSPRR